MIIGTIVPGNRHVAEGAHAPIMPTPVTTHRYSHVILYFSKYESIYGTAIPGQAAGFQILGF